MKTSNHFSRVCPLDPKQLKKTPPKIHCIMVVIGFSCFSEEFRKKMEQKSILGLKAQIQLCWPVFVTFLCKRWGNSSYSSHTNFGSTVVDW